VRNVGVSQHLGGLPRDRSAEHPVAHRRQVRVGTEEVRPPPDRRPDPARLMSTHQGLGDPSPGPAVRARRQVGEVLGEWPVDRAVGVSW
jgi:hypothetical protein